MMELRCEHCGKWKEGEWLTIICRVPGYTPEVLDICSPACLKGCAEWLLKQRKTGE